MQVSTNFANKMCFIAGARIYCNTKN